MTTTTSSTSTAVAVAEPVFTGPEQQALAGFLAGYAPGGYAPDTLRRSEAVLAWCGLSMMLATDCLYLPCRLGADLGDDRQGPPGDQRGRYPRRHGQRRGQLG